MLSTLLMFLGMGIGFATARLHNRGKIWQGNLLFGSFLLVMLGYLVYTLIVVWYD